MEVEKTNKTEAPVVEAVEKKEDQTILTPLED